MAVGCYDCSNPDCDWKSNNKIDFDEEGLCRNCEAGKMEARD